MARLSHIFFVKVSALQIFCLSVDLPSLCLLCGKSSVLLESNVLLFYGFCVLSRKHLPKPILSSVSFRGFVVFAVTRICDLLWFNFHAWCEVMTKGLTHDVQPFHTFTINHLGTSIEDQLSVEMWVYFYTPDYGPLSNMSLCQCHTVLTIVALE